MNSPTVTAYQHRAASVVHGVLERDDERVIARCGKLLYWWGEGADPAAALCQCAPPDESEQAERPVRG